MSKNKNFFEKRTDQSRIKTNIVIKYVPTWAKVIRATTEQFSEGRIAYVDLYSGPGRYEDGEPSTPILLLEDAIKNSQLKNNLITVFNDGDVEHIQTLKREVSNIPGIDALKHFPQITNYEVGEEIVNYLAKTKLPLRWSQKIGQ
jgi:three-Cys-motif partner protein